VDDGVHPTELVDLVGEAAGLLGAGEIANETPALGPQSREA
jgi:hypothetical protein